MRFLKNYHLNTIRMSRYLGEILFILFLFTGILTNQHYGFSWDEPQQRATGLVNYDYIFTDSKELNSWVDRDYGVAFELPLIFAEKILGLDSDRDIYPIRHLITHILFLFSAYIFFKLVDLIFKNKQLSSIGFILIVTQPLLYGHSFFNSKDLPFLSMFIISLFCIAKAFNQKNYRNFILLGLSIGILINIRLMGIMVPVLVLTFVLLDGILENRIRQHLFFATVMISVSSLTLYITWPYLWEDPIRNFTQAIENMSKFRFDREMLFLGEITKPTEIDWRYIPIWFSITNPIGYLIIGIIGIFTLLVQAIKQPFQFIRNTPQRNILFALAFFIAPVLAIIVLHSVLYDGWRQVYFIYPPFILLGLYAIAHSYSLSKKLGTSITVLITISILSTGWFMIKNFPLGHTYFNPSISLREADYARKHFEVDYWGLSYKTGFEYILENDTSNDIRVAVANFPGYLNENAIPYKQDQRMKVTGEENAKYFLTEYRFHSHEYDSNEYEKFHSIRTANNTVLQIFKIK